MATVEHMESPTNKRRKYGHTENNNLILNHPDVDLEGGWHLLQPIIENDVLCAKIPASMAFDLLAKWFQIIVDDQEKLRLFRQWIMPRYCIYIFHSFRLYFSRLLVCLFIAHIIFCKKFDLFDFYRFNNFYTFHLFLCYDDLFMHLHFYNAIHLKMNRL